MYGKEIADIDLLRYKLYCSKKRKCEIERLPPCMAALRQHCLRANYQTCIWHLCQEQTPDIPSPADHGRVFDEDGLIGINWMDCQPAPDEVRIYDTFLIDIFRTFDIFLMGSSNCILIPNSETLNHR